MRCSRAPERHNPTPIWFAVALRMLKSTLFEQEGGPGPRPHTKILLKAAGFTAVGVSVVALAPVLLSTAGFTGSGVAVGSVAEVVQSVGYGGATTGLFSILQSLGATGWSLSANAVLGGAAAATAAAVVEVVSIGTRKKVSNEAGAAQANEVPSPPQATDEQEEAEEAIKVGETEEFGETEEDSVVAKIGAVNVAKGPDRALLHTNAQPASPPRPEWMARFYRHSCVVVGYTDAVQQAVEQATEPESDGEAPSARPPPQISGAGAGAAQSTSSGTVTTTGTADTAGTWFSSQSDLSGFLRPRVEDAATEPGLEKTKATEHVQSHLQREDEQRDAGDLARQEGVRLSLEELVGRIAPFQLSEDCPGNWVAFDAALCLGLDCSVYVPKVPVSRKCLSNKAERESLGALLDLARDCNETGRYKMRLPRKAAEILIAVLRRCIPSSRLADGGKLEATPLLFYADLAPLYDGPDDAAHVRRSSLDKRAKRMQIKACFVCNRR